MLGICGTGMGSLALLLKEAGHNVTGSDENIYPPMSTQLENAGIKLFNGYKPENLTIVKPNLVIIGNVISRGNPEAEAVLTSGIEYLSMPQAVSKFFLTGRHSIVVAGTHGKTTTATLCAWLLESAGLSPSFLIGGVGKNLGVSACLKNSKYFVIEGDEYDTAFFDKGPKFLHYQPRSVILGPIEFDHADIYKDLAHVMSSFEKLADIIPSDGLLFACADSENTMKIAKRAKCKVITYGVSTKADYRPEKIKVSETGTEFQISNFKFQIPIFGNHNLQNAAGVLGLLLELGIDKEKLAKGLRTFENVKRRQEIRGVVNGITVIDDFAHHPTAIFETIKAMKMKYPKSRLISIFEPRSNTSKRNIFQHEFASAFKGSDIAIIAGIHRPEKVNPDERLDIGMLINEMKKTVPNSYNFATTDEIIEFAAKKAKTGDVVLIMSNGGFDNIHEKLLKRISSNS